MPTYIKMLRIDFHVAIAPPELLPILGKASHQLYSSFHTFDTCVEELRGLASTNAGFVADALLRDGHGTEYVLRARDGAVTATALDGSEDNNITALAERLRAREHAEPPEVPRDPGQRYEQPLYWPEPMLGFLQAQAARLDRSLSSLVQFAYSSSREWIATASWGQLRGRCVKSGLVGGGKRKASLLFPGEMLDELDRVAKTADTSVSHLVQAAVATAKPLIEAQRSAD